MSTINISIKPTSEVARVRMRLDGGYHFIQSRVDPLTEVRDIVELVDEYIDYLDYFYDYNIQVMSSLKSRGLCNGWMLVDVEVNLD